MIDRAGRFKDRPVLVAFGMLALATFITLLLVPVLYSIFVLDLKLTRWDAHASTAD